MFVVLVALLAAGVFGAADFFGGMAAKRMSALLATALTALAGLLILFLLLPMLGGVWSLNDVIWGGLSGVAGAVAIALLYACLAIGPMSILSPLTAVVSAIVPALWGAFGGERLSGLSYLALGLALVAVVLVGFVPEHGAVRPSLRGLLMATASGICIGGFYLCINQTSSESGITPLIAARSVNVTIMFASLGVLAAWRTWRGRQAEGAIVPAEAEAPVRAQQGTLKVGLALAVIGGVLDVIANVLVLATLRMGELTVSTVLIALYPAGTILLAAIVLKERIAPVQWGGLALALGASALLAVA